MFSGLGLTSIQGPLPHWTSFPVFVFSPGVLGRTGWLGWAGAGQAPPRSGGLWEHVSLRAGLVKNRVFQNGPFPSVC